MKRIVKSCAFSLLAMIWSHALVRTSLAEPITTGGFSFSDEQGGFQIKSVVGLGTRDDPFIIVEELSFQGPVILTIRRLPTPPPGTPELYIPSLNGIQISLEKITINKTKHVWVGFDLELQEKLHVPSTHGDGLSFDQVGKKPADIRANRFLLADRLFEPHDRIHFFKGHVNPGSSVRFSMQITDITPTSEFFLRQEPQFLYARNNKLQSAPHRFASMPGKMN